MTHVAETPVAGLRAGLPLDPKRIAAAIRRARRWLGGVFFVALVAGAILGKFVLKKNYVSTATLLWEPPSAGKTDAAHEITTLAASVKLPQNLIKVRQILKSDSKIDALAANIEVTVGSSSMLLAIKAKAKSAEACALTANATVDVFLDAQRQLSESRLRDVASALRQSLGQSEAALAEARAKYEKFGETNGVADFTEEQQAAVEEMARLRTAVSDAEVDLKGIEAREQSLKKSRADSTETVVMSRNEQNVDRLRSAQLESDLAQALARHPDTHPEVLALKAQLQVSKAGALASDTVTSQVVGRNAVRDAISGQVEESVASHNAQAQKYRKLDELERDASERARKLSAVQGEAVRLLSDVKAHEEHVGLLLKQIAMAEDDVRNANSNFQLLSRALPPEQSEKSVGRVVAVATPVLALVLALLVTIVRELAPLRVKTGREAAYWARVPVLCSTRWPAGEEADAAEVARECSDVLVKWSGVWGITAPSRLDHAETLSALLIQRLKKRGVRCALRNASKLSRRKLKGSLADWFESATFGRLVEGASKGQTLLLLLLPPLSERSALRTVQRWLDGTIVVLESAELGVMAVSGLSASLGRREHGLSLVMLRDELSEHASSVGDVSAAAEPLSRQAPTPIKVARRRPRKKQGPAVPRLGARTAR